MYEITFELYELKNVLRFRKYKVAIYSLTQEFVNSDRSIFLYISKIMYFLNIGSVFK